LELSGAGYRNGAEGEGKIMIGFCLSSPQWAFRQAR
jgi:hypothetical protein